MSPSVIHMAVICDWPLLQLGVDQAIRTQPDLRIRYLATTVDDLVCDADEVKIVLLITLQNSDQVTSHQVAQLQRQGHAVIVLSTSQAQSDAVLCIKAGARGYLSRRTDDAELVAAIRAVASGRDYFGASLAGRSIPAPPPHLTGRERQILHLVAGGATDREIATQLNITENTVHTHLERLRRKSGSRRRADLTRLALEYGIFVNDSTE
ncbi:response regulator transcription factor [Streptomyces sp. NPDC006393]|uniref:response regulator transcription factor n=1 Tax=Streptomyces sp. NPDC006393 TaxID=3156763 RepID=UPI0033D47530